MCAECCCCGIDSNGIRIVLTMRRMQNRLGNAVTLKKLEVPNKESRNCFIAVPWLGLMCFVHRFCNKIFAFSDVFQRIKVKFTLKFSEEISSFSVD